MKGDATKGVADFARLLRFACKKGICYTAAN
jgi:hypothetical protein